MRTQILRYAAMLRRAAVVLLHAARRFGAAVAEMNRQQRLSTIYRSPDAYLPHPDTPPETYREFLARTHGALLHEPSARARLTGRGVY